MSRWQREVDLAAALPGFERRRLVVFHAVVCLTLLRAGAASLWHGGINRGFALCAIAARCYGLLTNGKE